jgi:hypothetical protein
MITINPSDFNLKKILHESKLSTLMTKNTYHLYGLCQKDNPAIIIEYDSNSYTKSLNNNIESLVEFLELNGMETQIYDDSESNKISIGLRRDIREILDSNKLPIFASSVLCTIVYSLEGRVDIEQMKKYKLKSLPKLNSPTA